MNIWRFYLKKKYDKSYKPSTHLYAFTNKKKYADIFKETRDMKKFIVKKSEIDEDEFIDYVNSENQGRLLSKRSIETRDGDKNKKVEMELLLTDIEYQTIKDGCNQSVISEPTWWLQNIGNYRIFNKKVIHALKKLDFFFFYKMFMDDPELDTKIDDYSAPDFYTDEFLLLLSEFGHTFNLN